MKDLISIITTLYNYKEYIPDLIESVLKQTYTNWELIIMDDASKDDPLSTIEPYLKDSRIKYFRWRKNRGYSAAKNQAILYSEGKYIVMIDADDMLLEDSLEVRYEALKNSDKLWVHGEALVLQADGSLSDRTTQIKKQRREQMIKEGMDLTKEYHHRLIHAQSVMLKRELHKKVGLYDEALRFSSDNEMWRRIIALGHIPIHLDRIVAKYRVHDRRMSRSKYKKDRIAKTKEYIIAIVEQRDREGINENNTKLLKD